VSRTDVEREDVKLLLDTVLELSGIDFRGYAYSSIRRRVARAVQESGASGVAALHARLKEDSTALPTLTRYLTVHTTSLFRDPVFFSALREKVLPVLRTYPFLRIWIAGCSTGEEVYSLAILLLEHGLYEKCRIYATDLSDQALETARNGVYPLAAMQDYSRNYQLAGGRNSLSDYYTADAESVVLRRALRANVVFGTHNLVSDASFNEFHLILCRNVLIYFGRDLQARVHRLFFDSLISYGFLGLGKSESLRFTEYDHAYEAVDRRIRLFRKVQ
jgi:chemotaxis protein methyltransferase CheR